MKVPGQVVPTTLLEGCLDEPVVVEAVQRGIGSRLYGRGRYSPARESGVHHFHRLRVAQLA